MAVSRKAAPQKAFSALSPSQPPAEATPKSRQFQLSSASRKKLIGFKLRTELQEELELMAMELRRAVGRKVWPAHIVEAAIEGFRDLAPEERRALLERVS